jgi:hypothetical protein
MAITFGLTVFWNLKVGITVSIGISLVRCSGLLCYSVPNFPAQMMVVAQSSHMSIKIMGRIPGTHEWEPVTEENEADEEIPGVLIVRIRAMTFGAPRSSMPAGLQTT